MSLSTRLDDITLVEATQLHLFLSIILLMLLLRFFGVTPEMFDVALFSCVSMPATYALAYYHARVYKMGRFVVKKKPEPIRVWTYETVALFMSFIMGYMVYVALSGLTDLITYGAAFVTVQIMRVLILFITRELRMLGVDVQHPAVVILISLSTSLVALIGLNIFFSLLP